MIARKPKGKSPLDVERLIRKGGAPAKAEAKGHTVAVLLKIPADTLEEVDELVAQRKVPTHRSTWLMEAIVEKIEREV